MIAAGLHGIENELQLEPAFEGNAYESDKPRVPHNDVRRARPVRRVGQSPARPSARTSWTTT